MTLLLDIFSVLALGALWFATWGGFHQAITNHRLGNTEAITPARFEGVCIANTLWVLYACSLPSVNLPLALGCGAWIVSGALNILQMLMFPPIRSGAAKMRMIGILLFSAVGVAFALSDRELLRAYQGFFEWASVGSSIIFVHAGQISQVFYTRSRNTISGVSKWDVIAPFVDWSIFIVYSLLLGPISHWPVMLNSVLGFLTSGTRLYQFQRMRHSK